MKFFLSLFSFYINASIHVAFAAIALVGVSEFEYDIHVHKALYVFVFFGVITAYNFVKYAKITGLHHGALATSVRSIKLFSLVCFAIALSASLWVSGNVLIITFLLALLTFFYAMPLLKFKNLRSMAGFKVFVVAFVWAVITVLLPLVSADEKLNTSVLFTTLQRFLIVFVLIIPFDIRDMRFDAASLKTIPQQLGVQKSKGLGILLLLTCLLLEVVKGGFVGGYFLSLLMVCILTSAGIIRSSIIQKKYFASFWIEAIPIVWLVLLLVMSNLF